MKKARVQVVKPETDNVREKSEQIALRISGPLRDRITAVAAAMSDEAQTATLSDVARRCLIGHLPALERELGLVTSQTQTPAKPGGDTEHWVAGAKQRAAKTSAKT